MNFEFEPTSEILPVEVSRAANELEPIMAKYSEAQNQLLYTIDGDNAVFSEILSQEHMEEIMNDCAPVMSSSNVSITIDSDQRTVTVSPLEKAVE